MKKIKILVLTDAVWNRNNNVGNSFSNIFGNHEGFEIYNVSCQEGEFDAQIVKRCFQLSEKRIIKKILNKANEVGNEVYASNMQVEQYNKKKSIYDYIKILRFSIFYCVRDLIWATGVWKSRALEQFLFSIQPDIIFLQLQGTKHLNDLAIYVKEKTKSPMVAYAWDDVYTLQQFSLSPYYWIDRLIQRKKILKSVLRSEKLYGICERQCRIYKETFKKPCTLLYKGYSFTNERVDFAKQKKQETVKFLYAGTLGDGRFSTLCQFVKMLQQVNESRRGALLDIYTMNPITERMRNKIEIEGVSCFKGKVSNQELECIIEEADIVLHVEPFSLKGSLKVAMSFSTKLVDYFYKRKCIFSVGSKRSSSIQYLTKYNAALVATNKQQMRENLYSILQDKNIISFYEKQAYETGKTRHDIQKIQEQLYEDFIKIIEE